VSKSLGLLKLWRGIMALVRIRKHLLSVLQQPSPTGPMRYKITHLYRTLICTFLLLWISTYFQKSYAQSQWLRHTKSSVTEQRNTKSEITKLEAQCEHPLQSFNNFFVLVACSFTWRALHILHINVNKFCKFWLTKKLWRNNVWMRPCYNNKTQAKWIVVYCYCLLARYPLNHLFSITFKDYLLFDIFF
jgi:hypothetical protein